MCEHIFKAKAIIDNEWMQGYYVKLVDLYKKRESYRIYTGYAESDWLDFYPDWVEIDPNTICEYTGVNDKNDKMIFEGDIIRNHRFDETLYVRWDEEDLIWKLIPKDSKKDEYKTYELNEINIEAAWGDTPSYEIIGNIYD